MKKFLSENIKRNIFDDYMRLEIDADGSYSSNRPQYEFIQIGDIVPAQKTFIYADTTFYVPVSSSIKITEDLKDGIDYRIELEYDKRKIDGHLRKVPFARIIIGKKLKRAHLITTI